MSEEYPQPFETDAVGQFEKLRDECGVFGIYAPGEPVATITHDALHELQHRGQSGAGIFVYGEQLGLIGHKGVGLVDVAIPEALPQKGGNNILDEMTHSPVAIGHTRYNTAKSDDFEASQPFKGNRFGIAVGHNGHVEGAAKTAELFGIDVSNCVSDSHIITTIIDERAVDVGLDKALEDVLPELEGAYCLTIIDGQRLIGARDPWGFHPLALGELPDSKGYVLASEDVAFNAADAVFVRDIEPGEIVTIDKTGVSSTRMRKVEPRRECMYEMIYTARPDSTINGVGVYAMRKNLGRYLAVDQAVEADIVVGVPSSGLPAAAGYAQESGLPQVDGLFKNTYVSRSFIERAENRERILRRKLRPNTAEIAGKRLVLVDDSLIKGNTMRTLVGMLRDAGAAEVHVRLSAPRYEHPCYMGMDTGDVSNLIASTMSDEQICQVIGADSIGFNTVDRVEQATNEASNSARVSLGRLCTACATGDYPFPVPAKSTFIGLPKFYSQSKDTKLA